MYTTFLVGIGSALGGMARYGAALYLERVLGKEFPWGILFINVTGSFVIGCFFALTAAGGRFQIDPDWRIFVTVGVCGGYTTFSSFSLQTFVFLRNGEWILAGLNILGSVALCLIAVWLGFLLAGAINPKS